jgi:ABC-2 type transport system permease protein
MTAKYQAVARVTLESSLIYSRDVLLRATTMLLVLFVFIKLWTFTYSRSASAVIEGFSLRDMVWYLVIGETVVLSAPRVSLKIDEEVRSGALTYVLAKPYNYIIYHFAGYLGEATLRVPVNFVTGAALALVAVGMPHTSLAGVGGMTIAFLLSVTFNFLVEATIGLSAFWFEDSQPFFWIYQKLVFMIGGLFLPLEFLPRFLGTIAKLLPFATAVYAPARLFVGFTWGDLITRLALQLFWLACIGLVCAFVYGRAVRKVSLHGG